MDKPKQPFFPFEYQISVQTRKSSSIIVFIKILTVSFILLQEQSSLTSASALSEQNMLVLQQSLKRTILENKRITVSGFLTPSDRRDVWNCFMTGASSCADIQKSKVRCTVTYVLIVPLNAIHS